MTPEEVQQARIEAASEAFGDWMFRMHGRDSTCKHIDEGEGVLAAADGVAPPVGWWVKCPECSGDGDIGFNDDGLHLCPRCSATGRVLVLAPCGTCGGRGTTWEDYWSEDAEPCPDCSDGTIRRRLLELLGAEFIGESEHGRGWMVPERGDEREVPS